jgi:putative membrane protein
MTMVGDKDRERIAAALRQAQAGTAGELVVVIAGRSDSYLYIPLLWASFGALLVPGIILYLPYQWQWIMGFIGDGHDWAERVTLDHATVWAIQLAVFLALALLLRWEPVKMLVVPRSVKRHRAQRAAREHFNAQGLRHVQGRTGVLIYVSQGERYVEIIAGQAVSEKVDPETWKRIVDDFVRHARHGRIAEGFIGAVTACGDLLARHCPSAPGKPADGAGRLVMVD